MNPAKCRKIFERFEKLDARPVTELVYTTHFELLVSVMLAAQMTDKGVNKATEKLFFAANTPQAIIDLGEEKLKEYLKSINLYKTKAKHLMLTAEILLKEHQGVVPDTREALEKLPGVGRKTANVVLSIAFNQPTIAVDTHIFRVANRTKLAVAKTPRAVEDTLARIIPKKFLPPAHHWLVLHGRYVCTARKPHCKTCIIENLCEFEDKNL
jgi:endonuclease-3